MAFDKIEIFPWKDYEKEAMEFLQARYATSMFLMSNLKDQGAVITEHPNSGNLKVATRLGKVVGVFCLARRGNLLFSFDEQMKADRQFHELILRECFSEGIPLVGVIGAYEFAASLWEHMQARGVVHTCSFSSKEYLYRLGSLSSFEAMPGARLLGPEDFDQWLPIRRAYTKEEGLKDNLSDQQIKDLYIRYSAMKEYWGFFEKDQLVATAGLNARAMDIGQVGGVYTIPALRNRGISRRLLGHLLRDCQEIHGLRRMVLFTGEENKPAQRVYEKLGFQKIGRFGLFFA